MNMNTNPFFLGHPVYYLQWYIMILNDKLKWNSKIRLLYFQSYFLFASEVWPRLAQAEDPGDKPAYEAWGIFLASIKEEHEEVYETVPAES